MGDISDLRILYEIKNDIDMYIKYIDDEKTFKTYIPDADPNLSFTDQFIEKNNIMTDEQINNLSIIYVNESSSRSSGSAGSQVLIYTPPPTPTRPAPAPLAPAPPAAVAAAAVAPAAAAVAPAGPASTISDHSNNSNVRSYHSIASIPDPLDRTIALINELEEEQILKDAQLNIRQIESNQQELINEYNGATEITLNELIANPPNISSKDFDDENSSDLLMEYAISALDYLQKMVLQVVKKNSLDHVLLDKEVVLNT